MYKHIYSLIFLVHLERLVVSCRLLARPSFLGKILQTEGSGEYHEIS